MLGFLLACALWVQGLGTLDCVVVLVGWGVGTPRAFFGRVSASFSGSALLLGFFFSSLSGLCPSFRAFSSAPFCALPLSASAWACLPLCRLPSFSPLLWPCFWSFLVPCCSVLLALFFVSSLLVCRGLSWVSFGPFQFPSSPFGLRLPVLCVRARVLSRLSWVSVPLSFPLCEGGSALRTLCKNREKKKKKIAATMTEGVPLLLPEELGAPASRRARSEAALRWPAIPLASPPATVAAGHCYPR